MEDIKAGRVYTAGVKKNLWGRVLRKGESQRRSDGRYVYTYTDPLGRRKYVYAQDLVTLREKEAQLMKDQMDGLDIQSNVLSGRRRPGIGKSHFNAENRSRNAYDSHVGYSERCF